MFKEVLGEAFPVIEKFAPLIAGAIGSPGASFATSFALGVLAKAFGLGANDLHEIKSAIISDPKAPEKLLDLDKHFSADLDFKVHLDNKD